MSDDNVTQSRRVAVPEWTSDQIVDVRRIFRANGTIEDVIEKLQTDQSKKACRERAIKLGMRFIAPNTRARSI